MRASKSTFVLTTRPPRPASRDSADDNPSSLSLEQKLRLYEIFRDYLKHEDDLRSTRTGWLLTSQAFFFAAEGTFFSLKHVSRVGLWFEVLIAALGLCTALNHWARANQQDHVYDALEATYAKIVARFSPSTALRSMELGDLPPLRYGGAAQPGRSPYAVSYHYIFFAGWVAAIIVLGLHLARVM